MINFFNLYLFTFNFLSFKLFIFWFFRSLRPARGPDGPRARHHGLDPQQQLRQHLPPGQLRVRPDRCREQLGQGPLHRGRRADRLRAGRGKEGGGEHGLPAGVLNCALARGRDRERDGDAADLQDSGGVSRPDDDDLLGGAVTQGIDYLKLKIKIKIKRFLCII